jgi:thioredoxin 1
VAECLELTAECREAPYLLPSSSIYIGAMPITRIAAVLLVLFSGFAVAQQAQSFGKDQVSTKLRELYPDNADAKKEINEALQAAAKDHKRVLLVFGASWCFDCFALDYRFHQPEIQPIVDNNYHVVHVDIGRNDKNADLIKKYNIPIEKGVPSLAVLDSKGRVLYSTGEFESARRTDPQEIVKFLQTWKPNAS